MYARHFGLRGEPFALTPDPAFLYLSPDHEEALAALKVGLESRRGLMLMVAEVGMGKTTLLYSMLSELGPNIHTAYLSNTRLSFDELLRQALGDLGAQCESRDRVDMLAALNAFLLHCAAVDETAALVIDEAQNLDDETFENLRLLSNYETYTDKLLQIVLVGQPELEAKLARPSLRQVAERVAVRCHINPLSRQESMRYLEHRLGKTGGSLFDLFSPAAREILLWQARGIPRRLNILFHSALLFAYGRGRERVTWREAQAAVREKRGRGLVTIGHRASFRASGGTSFSDAGLWRFAAIGAGAAAAVVLALGWGAGGNVGARSNVETHADVPVEVAAPAPVPAPAPVEPPRAEVPPPAVADAAPVAEPAPEQVVREPEPETVVGADEAQIAAAPVAAEPAVEPEPEPEPQAVADPVPAAPEVAERGRPREIVVPNGTSLTAITLRYYGSTSPALVRRIKAMNPRIVNPDKILAGDRLRLPDAVGTEGGAR